MLTRPDAASGRRGKPAPSPVAELALAEGIPVLRPAKPNEPEFVAELAELAPDCCAVVAYGALLRDELLAVPRLGWINLHFSVLPAWRGAAPVHAAIAAGDEVTGATTFQIERALDSGPVYGVLTEAVRPIDTAGDLLARLADAGAGLLETTLDGVEDGALTAVPQPTDGVTIAPRSPSRTRGCGGTCPRTSSTAASARSRPTRGLDRDRRPAGETRPGGSGRGRTVGARCNSRGEGRRADRHRERSGAAGHGAAAGEEIDECGGLGARRPAG